MFMCLYNTKNYYCRLYNYIDLITVLELHFI